MYFFNERKLSNHEKITVSVNFNCLNLIIIINYALKFNVSNNRDKRNLLTC